MANLNCRLLFQDRDMFSRLNFLLLAVTLSALYVVDLRLKIKWQTTAYTKGKEEEIRLNQDNAELLYERSQLADAALVEQSAKNMNMHRATDKETVMVKFSQ